MKNFTIALPRSSTTAWHRTALCVAVLMMLNGCGGGDGVGAPAVEPAREVPPPPDGGGESATPPSPEQDAAEPPRPMAAVPRGLQNFGGTCYIAAPLQLLLHSEVLRAHALEIHPDKGFQALYRAYDNSESTDEAKSHLSDALDNVYVNLRNDAFLIPGSRTEVAIGPIGEPGDANVAAITLLDRDHVLPNRMVLSLDPDLSARRHLDYPEALIEELYGNARFVITTRVVDYTKLTQIAAEIRARLSGFVMLVDGGHFISYVRKGERWYKLDDSSVETVDLDHIESRDVEWISKSEEEAYTAAEEVRKAACEATRTPFVANPPPRPVKAETFPSYDYRTYQGIVSFSYEPM